MIMVVLTLPARLAICLALTLPLLVISLAMVPSIALLPFLPEKRSARVARLVTQLAKYQGDLIKQACRTS